MGKKKIKPKRRKKIAGKSVLIPQPEQGSTDGDSPVFSFKYCDNNKFVLWDLSKPELMRLMDFFKQAERLTWGEIIKQRKRGLRYDSRSTNEIKYKLPDDLSEDLTLIHLAMSGRGRVWGFRDGRIFHVIWFDKDHKVDKMS
ncbi:hypothetical protein H1R82_10585 [Thermoactinomyces intermedius]|jgi:hypothetical protein|uniref:Uncharacterized protein n=1 Tax=Thermoactinomyces intermedius TaxID=2024 RepID=A0A8I1AGW2_THEIN|nr:hypothetical protein [Thermoactinomyces intermedius]MBA4549241.1 hypothetical protein [Thermoactinomyces intermedius]MBA4837072.1 hypothetical protein [Thermoactinomyces intermedius]MBH8595743.1 hypothetical protein [Thermoactinomyces intermedius]